MPARRWLIAAAAVAVLAAGAVVAVARSDDGDDLAASPATSVGPTVTPTTAPPSTTTTAPTTTTTAPVPWPALPTDGVARALLTPTQLVLPVLAANPDGSFLVQTPCGRQATATGTPLSGAHVVLDPGHGGEEPGAVGPNQLTEKVLNLAVAERVAAILEAQGATVVLTRRTDDRVALRTRAAVATALAPAAFVSIHHNADPDGPLPGPGAETYFQIANPDSRRLAGLILEELRVAFSAYGIAWVGDTDAGAKYRPRSDGGDYYGILSRTAGIDGVLSEAAFISNPPEAELLATPEFQQVEAEAIARAIVRFVRGESPPDSVFVEPYPRTQPAGPGGGVEGCEDPPLG